MKKIIVLILLSPLFVKAQVSSICAQNVCIDTVYQPVTSIYLLARVISSTDPIVTRGWSFVSGPTTAPPAQSVDSALVTFSVPGVYTYRYTVSNSKGGTFSGTDVVTVIAVTVLSTVVNYVDGTSTSSKPIKSVITKRSDGSIKTVNP